MVYVSRLSQVQSSISLIKADKMWTHVRDRNGVCVKAQLNSDGIYRIQGNFYPHLILAPVVIVLSDDKFNKGQVGL